ncbi:DNA cytosine methyltransferase [Ensifer sp. ENS09]|uniref:DNA cytosine methyltransferase n=1 Tax=Ensifer sp. ENS09 TaxID=2769263 RepID=UPI00177CA174|nr:DNA cytosine methyltransferase [Ensifer sp. ENS09]MBD9651976.1 DNA cytosine methyltransferase [Ensifer sp. ENS09]
MQIDAVDLFCGAGGLSFGLGKAGLAVKAGLDFDPKCQHPYVANNAGAEFVLADLQVVPASVVDAYYSPDAIKLLAGCAPCQPFSTLSNGSNRQSSKKWPLLNEFSRVVREVLPDVVTMENVPVLRGQSIFQDFVRTLKDSGYHVYHAIVDAANYGVAQRRKRLVLLASRFGPVRLLTPEELELSPRTVRDAIGHLVPIKAGQRNDRDPLHKARTFTEINLKRIQASRPGGTWADWPEDLLLECHKRESGSTFKSVYGRMEWDKPSSTMTTQSHNYGTGRFGHPEQDRALSLREMAILQSFPEDYEFVPPGVDADFTSTARLIGNAVPVELGYAIGISIRQHVAAYQSSVNGKQ